MTRPGIDPVLLDPTRLSIVSLLAATEWGEFGWVRDSVGLSDSALSKQVTTLSKQGYVEAEKGYVGKRPRTWLSVSAAGRRALEGHVSALQGIVEQSRQAGEAHGSGERPGTGTRASAPRASGPDPGSGSASASDSGPARRPPPASA